MTQALGCKLVVYNFVNYYKLDCYGMPHIPYMFLHAVKCTSCKKKSFDHLYYGGYQGTPVIVTPCVYEPVIFLTDNFRNVSWKAI